MSLGNRFNPLTAQVESVQNNEFNPARYVQIQEDWTPRTTAGIWNWAFTNTGATWAVTNQQLGAQYPGAIRQQITHSAANTSLSVGNLGTVAQTLLTGGAIRIDAVVRVQAPTTNVTVREYWLGLADTTTATPTNAVFIGFNNSNFWRPRSIVGGVITTGTSVAAAVSNNVWTYLRIEINAAATSMDVYVNSTLVETLALPGTARAMWPTFYFLSTSTAAATAYFIDQDFYRFQKSFSTVRW
jgi:hypothetical protein